MVEPVLAGIIFMIVAIGAIGVMGRREGYYSTVTVFATGCLLYYVAIPVEMAVTRLSGDAGSSGVDSGLNSAQLTFVILLATLSFSAWLVGYRLSGFQPWRSTYPGVIRGETPRAALPASVTSLLVCSLLMALPVELLTGMLHAMQQYQLGAQIIYDNPNLSILLIAFFVPLTVIGATWSRAAVRGWRRPMVWTVVAVLAAFSVYINRKDAISLAFLIVGARYAGRNVGFRRTLLIVATGVITVLVVFSAYSLNRGGAPLTPQNVVTPSYGLFRGSDAGGPFTSIDRVITKPSEPRLGSTYLDVITLIVPKSVWPNRPVDVAESFAQETIPNWQPGMGSGFSMLAESYLNFGVAGAIIQYLALGWLWGATWKLVGRVLRPYSRTAWEALYCTVGFLVLLSMHRASVGTAAKTLLTFLGPLIVASIVVDRVLRAKVAKRRQAALALAE